MCQVVDETVVGPCQPLCDEVIALSTMDQHALRIYSKFVLVFKRNSHDDVQDTIRHLKNGLQGALSEIPDFAATVVPKPGSTRKELELLLRTDSGVPFKTVDHSSSAADSHGCHELLRGRSYEDFEKDNFPLTNIAEEVFFIPPAKSDDDCPDGVPSLLVQANIIDGGILVAIAWHHTVSDARGCNNLVKAWAKATNMSHNDGNIHIPEISVDDIGERWKLSYGTPGSTIADFQEYVVDTSARSPKTGHHHLIDCAYPVPADCVVSMWQFSPASMKALLSFLNHQGQVNGRQYTQAEALSALLWKHVSLARRLDITFPDASSLFTTRVDFRRRLSPPLDVSFVGNTNQPVVRTRLPIQELCTPSTSQSLATLAQHIREAVANNDEKCMRALIGYVDTMENVTDLVLEFDTCPGPDMAITDLSGLDVMSQDWGNTLGRAVCLRGFVRYRGFASFLPRYPDGGYPVHVQCESWAVERLKGDPVFGQYAQFLYSGTNL